MATKTKKKAEEEASDERVGVLSKQGDAMTEADRTSENDLAKSEDYNPEFEVDHAPDDPDEVEGVLAKQPTVSSDPQGMDDLLTFEG